ncbi:hypothetical protein Tco_0744911 [Tanacetum coccineum]
MIQLLTSSPTLTPFGDSDFLLLENEEKPTPFPGLADVSGFQGEIIPRKSNWIKVLCNSISQFSLMNLTEVESQGAVLPSRVCIFGGRQQVAVIIAKELMLEEKSAAP